MENTPNKAMISQNLFYLFPFKYFYFLYNILSCFLLSHWSSLGFHLDEKFEKIDEDLANKKSARFEEALIDDENDQCYLLGEDINMVMKRLGIAKHGFLQGVKMRWGCDEISRVFEEEKVRLEEVKDAFGVFDEDKDGFIDAMELQRVLIALGFMEGVDFKACQNMIRVFDNNGDEKIDFCEFARLIS